MPAQPSSSNLRPPTGRGWAVAGLAVLAVVGTLAVAALGLAARHEAFQTDARIAHRLLSQRASQHDAILATLVLLQPAAAEGAEQRLPAFMGQVLQVLRSDAEGRWPGDATRTAAPASLDAARQRSERSHRAELVAAAPASGGAGSGRYAVVMAGRPASFALVIDAAALVPADWPFAAGGAVQAVLVHNGLRLPLTAAAAGSAVAGPWRFGFAKPLAADSQPFTLQVDRAVGVADLPWAALTVWWLLLGTGAWAWRAWQAQRHARRRAQELLRLGQVGRLNALGELAAGLAHELNQPLAALSAGTQAAQRLLADDPPDLDTARQAMGQAVQQARRAAEVVARLRRLVERPDVAAQLQPCDAATVLRQALDLLQPELQRLGVAVQLVGTGQAPPLRADPVALEQIVHNLLGNALQALAQVPAGQRDLRLAVQADGDQVRLDVQDSGPGIAPDALPHLFEPFFTTREGGLGLGLSLCESLATGMGGSLQVAPAPSRGACFTLRLPAVTP